MEGISHLPWSDCIYRVDVATNFLTWVSSECHHCEKLFEQKRKSRTYIAGSGSKQQQVEGNGGDGVNDEPAFDVVERDFLRVSDDLAVVQVRGAEVDKDVSEEHDVDDKVDDDEGIGLLGVGVREARRWVLVELGASLVLVEKKSRDVRCEDSSVENQEQDDPVPHGFERRVVQDDELGHGSADGQPGFPSPVFVAQYGFLFLVVVSFLLCGGLRSRKCQVH